MENVAYNCTHSYGTYDILEGYLHYALIYTADHIFTVLPIKYIINEYGELNTPFKLATGTKPSVSHLRVLFILYVVKKSTANVVKRALIIHHQA